MTLTLTTSAPARRRVINALMGYYDPERALADQLRNAAHALHGKMEAGNLRRLPQCELVELRGLMMFLEAAADEAAHQADMARRPTARERGRWWRFWR